MANFPPRHHNELENTPCKITPPIYLRINNTKKSKQMMGLDHCFILYELSLMFWSPSAICSFCMLTVRSWVQGPLFIMHDCAQQNRVWVRLCTASKQHLNGSVDNRALAPPVRRDASVVIIYTQEDPTLLALEEDYSQAFVLFKDRVAELNSMQQRTILLPHLLPLKDQDRSISTLYDLFSQRKITLFFFWKIRPWCFVFCFW